MGWIDRADQLSVRRQCYLLDLQRSTYYYHPCEESGQNLFFMRLLDEQYTETPFYGVPRMTAFLRRSGHQVNPKRVSRLLLLMGLQAIFPRKNLSKPAIGHKIYPYLLRGVKIEGPNHVWSTDITYVRMIQGFLYLCAIIDWFSRKVLAWRISNSLEPSFCVETLKDALATGYKPRIFNSDQGSQFTAEAFTSVLLDNQISISMDGRGRALDNIFVERLWRTVKYEHIFLHEYQNGKELHKGLTDYFQFYNYQRPHQSLNYMTPAEVFDNPKLILP